MNYSATVEIESIELEIPLQYDFEYCTEDMEVSDINYTLDLEVLMSWGLDNESQLEILKHTKLYHSEILNQLEAYAFNIVTESNEEAFLVQGELRYEEQR